MRAIRAGLAAVLLLASAAPAAARPAPVTVVVAASVDETLRRAMPPDVWTKLVDDWVNASRIIRAPGTELPTPEACRTMGALYAVAAHFGPAPRILGAGDLDRKHAIVRASVLECLTGKVEEKTIPLESEPLSRASAGDYEPEVERTWTRPAHDALARQPFTFATLMRISRVDGASVEINAPSADLKEGDVLRVFADEALHPKTAADTVITIVTPGKPARGTWIPSSGVTAPKSGDYITLVRPETPAPAATKPAAVRR